MIGMAINQFTDMIKQLLCKHEEEDIVQTVRMPYGYNKCCFKCRRCGRERWS